MQHLNKIPEVGIILRSAGTPLIQCGIWDQQRGFQKYLQKPLNPAKNHYNHYWNVTLVNIPMMNPSEIPEIFKSQVLKLII